MLTWESFQNTWAKPKVAKGSRGEEMVVDQAVGNGGVGTHQKGSTGDTGKKGDSEAVGVVMDTEMTDKSEMDVETGGQDGKSVVPVMKDVGQVIEGRLSVTRKLPIFAFQRKGIAVTAQRRYKFLNPRQYQQHLQQHFPQQRQHQRQQHP